MRFQVHSVQTRRRRESPGPNFAAMKPRNIQFSKSGRTEILATGNFGDWHAAVGEVPWSSVPETPINSRGKLVLHPLWNRQPVQIITQ